MSSKRRGLGRGLDSLLDMPPRDDAGLEGLEARGGQTGSSLPTTALAPNPQQPRTDFDVDDLEDLAASIRSRGLMQPIIVSPVDDGYVIVAGERRWRAAQLAGLERVPVVHRQHVSEQEMLELALIENLQRSDLNAIDEAAAYAALRDRHRLSQVDIAKSVGKSRAAIANSLRLLELPGQVRGWLKRGDLSAGQARPLLALGDNRAIVAMAEKAIKEGLSARQLESLVRERGNRKRAPRTPPDKEVHTLAAEERLTKALQTRVEIQRRGKKGVIKVHFHSEDELIRLFDRLKGG